MGSEEVKRPECLVSVITIVLNGEMHIEQTINSVLAQTHPFIEYIIIDGGSTDGTIKKIEKYRNRIEHFISECDEGIYHAINKGISLARGSLIGLIHCGDYYEPDAVSSAVDGFVRTRADAIYGDIKIIDEDGGKGMPLVAQSDHRGLKRRMTIFHPAVFVSKACYERHGLYDIRYRNSADYDFFLRISLFSAQFHHVDKIFSCFRSGGKSSSAFPNALKENFLIHKKYFGLFYAARIFLGSSIYNNYLHARRFFLKRLIGEKNYLKVKQWQYHNARKGC